MEMGQIRGVRVVPSALPLTASLYADDLLLMGATTVEVVNKFVYTLNQFSLVSGQKVGPDKSSIWFSRPTSKALKADIIRLL